jgi:plastocyanin
MILWTRAALFAAWIAGVSSAYGATVEGAVAVGGRQAFRAVVYLEATGTAPSSVPAPHVIMDQKNLAFVPDVLPVMRGTVVEFTNSDDVQHNVFSPSAIAGKFNLGTYGPGATRMITLDKPGDARILCNIHMEMEAHILVLDFPYFTVAQDGRYRIAEVPAGTYTLKVWKGRWLPFARSVELPAAGNLTVDIAAEE